MVRGVRHLLHVRNEAMSATHDPIFGCMLWPHVDRDGYGRIGRRLAHRAAYEDAYGAIPDGMEIEHACRVRNCVAPHHLELVTRSDNERLKQWRHRVRKQTCKRGHDLRLTAIVLPTGGRVCRQCNREALNAVSR